MQLRYLSTLQQIAGERNSTVIFPVPIDLLRGLGAMATAAGQAAMREGSREAG
jgi:hypothetical protein